MSGHAREDESSAESQTVDEVLQAEQALDEALLKADIAALETLLAPEATRTAPSGTGFDYSVISGTPLPITRHVARIERGESRRFVMILDDTAGTPPAHHTLQWDRLESAVRAIDDGYWVIGSPESLDFDHALPRRFQGEL